MQTERRRQLSRFLIDGTASLRLLFSPGPCIEGAAFGLAAWLLTSLSFVWLCSSLSLDLPWPAAMGIYPLAMLLGALSFVPGDIGTTEAAIVVMLRQCGASLDLSIAAAIGIGSPACGSP